jgi:hypothetical protein
MPEKERARKIENKDEEEQQTMTIKNNRTSVNGFRFSTDRQY